MTQQLSNRSDFVFKDCLRLMFVVFSLYLMGDVFNRWDGFSYYASFSEFLPSVALAFILWSIVSVFFAVPVWAVFQLLTWVGNRAGLKIKIDHLLLNAALSVIIGVLFWKGKKLIWPDIQTTFAIKLSVLLFTVLLSIYLAWLFRNRAVRWFEVVGERITPLVWIFGSILFLSIPLVAYHALSKNVDRIIPQEMAGQGERPNIILVTFDALAAREMSLYGYHRETTPFIDKWAKNATVFTMAKAASNFTTPAVASLMTGKRVWTHQTYHIAGSKPVRNNVESLPAMLKRHGYFNMAFVVNPFASVNVLGIANSFDIAPLTSELGASDTLFGWKFGVIDRILYKTFGDKIRLHNWILKNEFIFSKFLNLVSRNISKTPVPPEKAFDRFIKMIEGDLPQPFFAWIHVFPPHDPYLPPEPFKGMYNPSDELSNYKEQEKLIEESYKYLFQYQPYPREMQPSIDIMRDRYDESIMYIDRTFKDFMAEFDSRNTNNTVIILSSDHGESFDHGYFTHGGPFLYEQVTHVPLIIKEPGQKKGLIANDLVEQIDISATILDLAGISLPPWMEGRSLVPALRGGKLPAQPAFSMTFEGNRSRGHQISKGSIAVWDGNYKLIHYLEKNESLLFNLNKDPEELDNLIDSKPEAGKYLLGLILDNLDNANKRIRNRKQGAEQ